jgi:hypothetical protein
MDGMTTAPFVVRVAGLPQDALRLTATPASFAALDAALALADRQRVLADEASGILYAHIGQLDDATARRGLLRLRRAVWNARLAEYDSAVGSLAGVLPPTVIRHLDEWRTAAARYAEAVASAERTYASEMLTVADRLRTAIRTDGLSGEIGALAPSLAAAMDGNGHPSEEALAAVINFVARAAGKTTPRAGLASWGVGTWQEGKPAAWRGHTHGRRRNTELNTAITERLRSSIVARAVMTGVEPVRANPSLTLGDGQACFVSPGPPEGVLRLRTTPALDRILREASRRPGTPGEIAGSFAADPAVPAQVVLGCVHELIARGALTARPPAPDQDLDHLASLIRVLKRVPGAGPAPDLLTALRDGVQCHAGGDPRWPVPRLRGILDRLAEDFRWPDAARTAAGPPVFTDSVLTGARFCLDRAAWPTLGGEFAVLAALARHLDPLAALRPAAGRIIRAGLGTDVAGLADALRFLLRHGGEARREADPVRQLCRGVPVTSLPSGPARDKARRTIAAAMAESGGTGEVLINPADLRSASDVTDRELYASVAFFGQPCLLTGRPAFVLNGVEAGYSRTASHVRRLLHRVRAEDDIPPEHWPGAWLPRQTEQDVLYVTLTAAAGSNVNLRDPGPLTQLDYPGVCPAPGTPLISPADLEITCRPAGPVLRHRSDGRRVIIVPQGRMADFHFPPVMRLLLRLFGPPAQVPLQSSLAVFGAPDAHGIRRLPRIRCGQLVLFRASHLVPAGTIPCPDTGDTTMSQFLRLEAWRRANRLPATCYLRALGDRAIRTKWRKPVYVDFRSAFCVRLLSRLPLEPSDSLLMQEVLPAPEDIPADEGGERYACEAVLEYEF